MSEQAVETKVSVTHYSEDILPHINAADSLTSRAANLGGCITLLGLIQVCYELKADSVVISACIQTPVGKIDLGSATLNLTNPSITLGGGAFGFKAELTVTFDFKALVLKICGTLCAPFVGCTSGCTSIQL